MRKILITLLLTLGLVFAVTGCGGTSSGGNAKDNSKQNQDQEELSLSIPEPEGAKFDVTAEAFKEKLEELTDGQMTVKIHYNNELGGEREVFEMMGLGSVDMAVQSAGPMGNWVKKFDLFDLPYLFDDRDHVYAVLDGEIGEELNKEFEDEANVKILGWVENGFVTTTSNVPIKSADDVKDMKIRVQENELQIDSWNAFGADATPMAWDEVFTGLQQGVIDGHSNSLATIETSKIYEVQDYVAFLEDRFAPGPIAISKQKFDSLTKEQQEAVEKAGEYAEPIGREPNQKKIEKARDFLEDEGIEFTEPDQDSFKELTDSVYEKWTPEIGEDLIEEIEELDY